LFAAGAELAEGEAVEGDFDDVFGFGAGNQNVGSHLKFEAPEFLFAGEVLGWFAGGSAVEEGEVKFDGF